MVSCFVYYFSFCLLVFVLVLRPGSVVAQFKLLFKNRLEDEKALAPLKKAIQDGKLGPLTVEPESLKIMKDIEGICNHILELE